MGQSGSKSQLNLVLPTGLRVSYDREITVGEVLLLFPDHYVTCCSKRWATTSRGKLAEDTLMCFGRTYSIRPCLEGKYDFAQEEEERWRSGDAESPKEEVSKRAPFVPFKIDFRRFKRRKRSSAEAAFQSSRLTKSLTAPRATVTPLYDLWGEDSDSPPTPGRFSHATSNGSSMDACTPASEHVAPLDWPTSLEAYGWTPDSPAKGPHLRNGSGARSPLREIRPAEETTEEEEDEALKEFERQIQQVQDGGGAGLCSRQLSKWRPKLACISEADPQLLPEVLEQPVLTKALTSRW